MKEALSSSELFLQGPHSINIPENAILQKNYGFPRNQTLAIQPVAHCYTYWAFKDLGYMCANYELQNMFLLQM
jgi:hypothetical protein